MLLLDHPGLPCSLLWLLGFCRQRPTHSDTPVHQGSFPLTTKYLKNHTFYLKIPLWSLSPEIRPEDRELWLPSLECEFAGHVASPHYATSLRTPGPMDMSSNTEHRDPQAASPATGSFLCLCEFRVPRGA